MSRRTTEPDKEPRKAAAFARLLAPLLAPRIQGFVDKIVADEVFGWAFNRTQPGRRVLVVARLDGEILAETLADLPRRDLVELGKADGRCGFRLKLPDGIDPGQRDNVKIEAVVGLYRKPLKRAARLVANSVAAQPAVVASRPAEVKGPAAGFIERHVDGVLKGWASDPNNPDEPPSVDVFDGELFVGVVRADIERPRLQASGAPAGARGFEFRMPPGRTPAADALRVRIARSRIDLRRSKSYPGEGASGDQPEPRREPVVAEIAPAGSRQDLPDAPSPMTSEARETVGLVVCGGDRSGAIGATLRSWAEQDWPRTLVAAIASGTAATGQTPWFGPDDEAPLRDLLKGAATVVFALPGVRFDPDLARVIRALPFTHAISWSAGEDAQDAPDPALAARLGECAASFALTHAALRLHREPLAAALAARGPAHLQRWAAEHGLYWTNVPAPLSSAHPADTKLLKSPRPSASRRLTIAAWSGWGAEPPPAVASLLEGAHGYDVEMLCPASAAGAADRLPPVSELAVRSLRIRLVDCPPEPPRAWTALSRAATGEVVILCHGSVRLKQPESLRLAAEAALQPGVGAIAATLGGDEPRGARRAVPAASALLLAISTQSLAAVGGFRDSETGQPADLDLGLRLASAGRPSVQLSAFSAEAPQTLVDAWRASLAGATATHPPEPQAP